MLVRWKVSVPFVHAHPADLVGEAGFLGHVCDVERAVGRVVEQTLVESRGEEADRRAAVNQRESEQAADIEV